jgi:hypothetical protein
MQMKTPKNISIGPRLTEISLEMLAHFKVNTNTNEDTEEHINWSTTDRDIIGNVKHCRK